MNKLNIDTMLVIDETGIVKAPNIRQLQDKDVALLYARDTSTTKSKYIKECGVIYYLGDPKSPARQQGLSDQECLKMAIENYELPIDYKPDTLVKRLIDKYYKQNITEAGVALEALQRSVHLISIAAVKINERLNNQMTNGVTDEDLPKLLNLMDSVSKRISEIPSLTKALATAYDNLRNEEEEQYARGGVQILSSMDADEEIY